MRNNIKNITILFILMALFVPFNVFGQGAAEQNALFEGLEKFWYSTGFANFQFKYLAMILVGIVFIILAVKKGWEPLLLIPIGFGMIIGNIPLPVGGEEGIGIYDEGSVLNILYSGVIDGWYPPLVFLGIGAMTDFSSLISNPKLMLLGAAAQTGIFITFFGAYALGFTPEQAGAIGIIGGADGPTAIFLTSKLAPELIGTIAVAAYSYMALVPLIQPPVMNLLTTKKEKLIRMKPPRPVSKTEKIAFPIIGMVLTTFIAPSALPLLGMLFLGNLLKESTVTERLAETARFALINSITILLGLTVGASTQADRFITLDSLKIFGLGALSFVVATASGVLFAKLLNVFLKEGNKINPLIGSAGVSAVPAAARVSQEQGLKADKTNHLLMHAMAPNVAGVIGSAVAAGILLNMLT
ncbi:Glutaconyl-CoA decarboxylase subunit beta [bioreactor metagenome]|jgi:oxaloacetate decarboxylase beta subunit|uniref:Glutaconyl-CoA decarboxylase subunit beta n=1 Tax=bioreactor metagenome TaxID=1076179 RepID=A0A644W146_9ZZZZ|nr:sodium ion-translocating decarboxylase subunit beta [Paludibacter sp.]